METGREAPKMFRTWPEVGITFINPVPVTVTRRPWLSSCEGEINGAD